MFNCQLCTILVDRNSTIRIVIIANIIVVIIIVICSYKYQKFFFNIYYYCQGFLSRIILVFQNRLKLYLKYKIC